MTSDVLFQRRIKIPTNFNIFPNYSDFVNFLIKVYISIILYKIHKEHILNNNNITKLCKVGKKPLTFSKFMVQ